MWGVYKTMQEESKVFQIFFYKGNQIRTVEHKGETWWVAIDVCKVLEIENVSLAVNGNDGTGNTGLDEDEKDYIMIHNVVGIKQATLCVNEPGLYHLISKSRTLGAKAFGRWIRHEVLPTIRKTGRYSLSPEEPQKPNDQLLQWLNWSAAQLTTLSKNEHMRLIHYAHAMLGFLEASYNCKYPQRHVSTGRTETPPDRNAHTTTCRNYTRPANHLAGLPPQNRVRHRSLSPAVRASPTPQSPCRSTPYDVTNSGRKRSAKNRPDGQSRRLPTFIT
jgi:prophage antirepressor-like protein